MPVTPFHFGPGAVLKAIGGRWFSFRAFATVQIAIDVESIWNIVAGNDPIHDRLHTMPGALAVGLVVAVAGRPLLGLPWTALVTGAALGAVTHVLLDAVMHADSRPFGAGNPLHVPGSFVLLHVLCLASGVLGAVLLIARARRTVPAGSPIR
jgi:hypothetical protein